MYYLLNCILIHCMLSALKHLHFGSIRSCLQCAVYIFNTFVGADFVADLTADFIADFFSH